MMSSLLMKVLVGFYVVILIACIWERNWWRAMYWTGAAMLNIAIIGGMK